MENGTTAPLERLGGNKQDPINHKSQILILFILMRPVCAINSILYHYDIYLLLSKNMLQLQNVIYLAHYITL